MTCPNALRLHRLSQTARRELGARRFSIKSVHKLFPVTSPCAFDCAGSRKTVVPLLVPSMAFLQDFHGALLAVPVIHEDLEALVEVLVRRL